MLISRSEKIMEYLFKYYKSYFELLSNDSAEIKLGTTIIISNIARRGNSLLSFALLLIVFSE